MSNKQKNKTKNKKYTNRPLIILIIVATLAVVFMFWQNYEKTKIVKTSSNTKSSTTEVEENLGAGALINMENTTNAKVENGEKENTSTDLLSEKIYKGMNVKDIQLKTENYISNFKATVVNNTGVDYGGGKITMIFTNQDGTEYARLNGVLPAIKNGEQSEIIASTTADIINAYNFTIE